MQDDGAITPGSTMPMPGGGYPGPGFFQASIGAVGYGHPYGQGIAGAQASQLQGGAMLGQRAGDFLGSTVPGVIGGGLLVGQLASPLMMAGGGPGLRALGRAVNWADPFSWAFSAGGAGWRAGTGAARLGAGLMGGGGGLGLGGAMLGGVGAAAAAAVPLGIGAAAYGVASYGFGHISQGAQNATLAQTLMAQIGPSAFGGIQTAADIRGNASALGRDMSRTAHESRLEPEQIGEIAKFLDSQKFFQTVGNASEFRSKFKDALEAIKKISREMQTSIEDASQVFAQVRQQGFYSTVDVKGQALRQAGLANATGRSVEEITGMGLYGAQMARSHGMRGRFGAQFAQQVQASLDLGLMNGTVSEEIVNEMGGAEAATGRLANLQMGFLGSARGRMMIANALGADGRVDGGRAMNLLGGNMGLGGMVDGAIGTGLRGLWRAGQPSSQQEFMQYAGMAMVNTALAQRQMLGMSTDENGIIRSLMTMGAGRSEARLLLQQTGQLGQMLDEQGAGQTLAQQRAQFESNRERYSLTGQVRRGLYNYVGAPAEDFGSSVAMGVSNTYARAANYWTGYREYEGGDDLDDIRRGLSAGFGRVDLMPVTERGRGPFAVPSHQEQFRERYRDYLRPRRDDMAGGYPGSIDRFGRRMADAGGGMIVPENVMSLEADAMRYSFSDADSARVANLVASGALLNMAGQRTGKASEALFGRTFESSIATEDLIFEAAKAGGKDRFKGDREEWDNLDPQARRKYVSAVSKSIAGVDSPLATSLRERIGDLGLIGNTNIDTIEESYGSQMGEFLDSLGAGALTESMKTKGSVRSIVGDMFEAIASQDEGRIAQARRRLDTLTGDEKEAALAALKSSQMGGGAFGRIYEQFGPNAGRDSLRTQGAIYGAARKTDTSMQMSLSAWSRLEDKGETGVFGQYKDAARSVALAGSRTEYQSNWTDLVSRMADGGIDASEAGMLVQLSGGQRGAAALARNINDVLGSDAKKQREALSSLGVSDDQASEILASAKDMRGTARTTQLMQSLTKATGVLSPDRFSGGTERTIADTEATAWDRQTQFVLAVDSFLARFGKTAAGKAVGLEGMDPPTSQNP